MKTKLNKIDHVIIQLISKRFKMGVRVCLDLCVCEREREKGRKQTERVIKIGCYPRSVRVQEEVLFSFGADFMLDYHVTNAVSFDYISNTHFCHCYIIHNIDNNKIIFLKRLRPFRA